MSHRPQVQDIKPPMTGFEPRNPDYAVVVAESFKKQGLMRLLGIQLSRIDPGLCELRASYKAEVSQQHGFFHGALVAAALETAGGYAALTLMPRGSEVLTAEYKINFAVAAEGEELIATGRVIRPGRRVTVAEARAYCLKNGVHTLCAILLQSLVPVAAGTPPDTLLDAG